MHLGSMHPYEQALTLVLAFGPFLVLGLVIVVRRRAEDREAAQTEHAGLDGLDEGAGAETPEPHLDR